MLRHRGILLDVFVFLMNLFFARYLVQGFMNTWDEADKGSTYAKVVVFAMFGGMLVLMPIGTILKRWRHHEDLGPVGGFVIAVLSSPVFYFVLSYGVYVKLLGLALQFMDSYGVSDETTGSVFVWGILLGLILSYVSAKIVENYFDPPTNDPPFAFLKSQRSEVLGDACLWLNMIFYQVIWIWLTSSQLKELAATMADNTYGRLGRLLLLAVFVYIPPRLVYLAEDFNRPLAWATILLANLPIVYRFWTGGACYPSW